MGYIVFGGILFQIKGKVIPCTLYQSLSTQRVSAKRKVRTEGLKSLWEWQKRRPWKKSICSSFRRCLLSTGVQWYKLISSFIRPVSRYLKQNLKEKTSRNKQMGKDLSAASLRKRISPHERKIYELFWYIEYLWEGEKRYGLKLWFFFKLLSKNSIYPKREALYEIIWPNFATNKLKLLSAFVRETSFFRG